MRRVARWARIRWEAFAHLPEEAQAGYIAEYESEHRLSSLEHQAQQEQIKRKQRQQKIAATMRRNRG